MTRNDRLTSSDVQATVPRSPDSGMRWQNSIGTISSFFRGRRRAIEFGDVRCLIVPVDRKSDELYVHRLLKASKARATKKARKNIVNTLVSILHYSDACDSCHFLRYCKHT